MEATRPRVGPATGDRRGPSACSESRLERVSHGCYNRGSRRALGVRIGLPPSDLPFERARRLAHLHEAVTASRAS